MGKQDIIKALKKAQEPLTSTEIAEQVDINARSVRRLLNSLINYSDEVNCRRPTKEEELKKYGRRVRSPRIRVYFLK